MHTTPLPTYSEAGAACFDALNCPCGTANPFVHYRLGQCEVRLGNHERAVSHLLQAYMLDGEEIFLAEEDGRDEKEAIARIIHDMFIRRHSFHALI